MGRDVVDFNADDTTPTNTGHAIVAINVEAFQPVAEFKKSVDALIRDLRNSQRLPGVDRDPAAGRRRARRARGPVEERHPAARPRSRRASTSSRRSWGFGRSADP